MEKESSVYLVLAFYHFASIENVDEEIAIQKKYLTNKDAKSRIYINGQGINAQMSILKEDGIAYIDWMKQRELYRGMQIKIHTWHEHAFPRLSIKKREHLVAYDEKIDLSKGGEHISPEKWKQLLEEEDRPLLLDIRNDYEWDVGRFSGAERPPCDTFREFEEYADHLKADETTLKKPVMMYCTGGIRCELFSAVLKEKGFEKVYQLDGGVINYGLEMGSSHWLGKLFVFDDRMAVPISNEPTEIVGKCAICEKAADQFYNCANMHCNTLFIACPECLKNLKGCCKEECQAAPRVRPYHEQDPHKPFRKWHHYFREKK